MSRHDLNRAIAEALGVNVDHAVALDLALRVNAPPRVVVTYVDPVDPDGIGDLKRLRLVAEVDEP